MTAPMSRPTLSVFLLCSEELAPYVIHGPEKGEPVRGTIPAPGPGLYCEALLELSARELPRLRRLARGVRYPLKRYLSTDPGSFLDRKEKETAEELQEIYTAESPEGEALRWAMNAPAWCGSAAPDLLKRLGQALPPEHVELLGPCAEVSVHVWGEKALRVKLSGLWKPSGPFCWWSVSRGRKPEVAVDFDTLHNVPEMLSALFP